MVVGVAAGSGLEVREEEAARATTRSSNLILPVQ